MHGRSPGAQRLLGWRGPYAGDTLGWHDPRAGTFLLGRAAEHAPDPRRRRLPPTRRSTSRARAALHSNGDLSGSHYDMNLVYVDALFRHLLWTGDLEFARRTGR